MEQDFAVSEVDAKDQGTKICTEDREMQIDEKRKERLTSIMDMSKQIRNAIGDLEIRKQELFIQYMSTKDKTKKEAEAALLEIGISPSDLSQYRIDIKTGKVTKS